MAKLERDFQAYLIKELKRVFQGCIGMKNDSSYIQGIPDLLVLYKDKWASLEVKKFANARKRPNQEYYVDLMDSMSFSRFISPENKDEVLCELYKFFGEQRGHLCDLTDTQIWKDFMHLSVPANTAG